MNLVPFPPMKRPLIAILRGLKPEEAEGVVSVLIETGVTAIEIPLNSPDPFRTIEIAVKKAPAEVLIGAGTRAAVGVAGQTPAGAIAGCKVVGGSAIGGNIKVPAGGPKLTRAELNLFACASWACSPPTPTSPSILAPSTPASTRVARWR